MRLLVATQNAGKIREYAEIFAALPFEIVSVRDVGLETLKVDEPYDTFEANADHKARTYADASGLLALADDSGLEVNMLNGRPGVYTARYAGDGASDRDRYMKLLGELADIADEQRGARFVCVISVAQPGKTDIEHVRGECMGRIAQAPGAGVYGFGFDPVFIPSGFEVTFSQLPPEQKHSISHRGRALALVVPVLERLVQRDNS
jgi:XTP/dITP diphosphohydrolase